MSNGEQAKQDGMDRAGELPVERRVAERRAEPPALVTIMADTIAALKEQLAGVEAENTALRESLADDVSKATMLRDLSNRDGGLNMQFEGGACQLLADAFGNQFRDKAGANYLEMQFVDSKGLRLLVTLQRVDGKTPGQLKTEAEQKLADVLASQPAAPVQPDALMTAQALHLRNLTLDYAALAFQGTTLLDGDAVVATIKNMKSLPIDISVLGKAPAAPPVQQPGDVRGALAEFTDYVVKNYPTDTIISDPSWHAPRLFRAAQQALATTRPSAIPADVQTALDRMCTPLDESYLKGATAEADARCMAIIKRYIESATRPSAALTDDQIMDMAEPFHDVGGVKFDEVAFARAILAASGGALAVPEVIREGVEAAFEEKAGWRTKIAAAVRALPAAPAIPGGAEGGG